MANLSQDSFQKQCSSSSMTSVVVVMVPLPAQSHLNQFLELSQIISSHNIPVHYVGSDPHNSQVKSRATHALNQQSIHFHDFPIPHSLSPPPNDTKFPSHLVPSFEASVTSLRQPFADLLISLSNSARRIVIIHNPSMSSVVQDSCRFPNTEVSRFHPAPAAYHFSNLRDTLGIQIGEDDPKLESIPSSEGSVPPEFQAFMASQIRFAKNIKASGHVYGTCRLIESGFLDFMLEIERKMTRM